MDRTARILVLLSAFSATLLGVAILSASTAHEPWPGASFVAASHDFDPAAESGAESVEDEREEESESKTHLFPGRFSGEIPATAARRTAGQDSVQFPRRRHHQVVPIRGPPCA